MEQVEYWSKGFRTEFRNNARDSWLRVSYILKGYMGDFNAYSNLHTHYLEIMDKLDIPIDGSSYVRDIKQNSSEVFALINGSVSGIKNIPTEKQNKVTFTENQQKNFEKLLNIEETLDDLANETEFFENLMMEYFE